MTTRTNGKDDAKADSESTAPVKHANIIDAICAVMAESRSVSKRGENKFQNYKYAMASDLLYLLQPSMARNGIVVLQREQSRELLEDGSMLLINYLFDVRHNSDTSLDNLPWSAMTRFRSEKGVLDDKAVNKVHTAALKYFLTSLFKVPAGDFDDADGANGEVKKVDPICTPAQIREVSDLLAQSGRDQARFLSWMGIDKLGAMTQDRYKTAIPVLTRATQQKEADGATQPKQTTAEEHQKEDGRAAQPKQTMRSERIDPETGEISDEVPESHAGATGSADDVLQWADAQFTAIKVPYDLEAVFNDVVAPRFETKENGHLWNDVLALYRKHETRLAP